MSGNNVSHSQRKTKRKFLPNLRTVKLPSDALASEFKFKITNRVLRSIEIHGGLDGYLLNTNDRVLSCNALDVKKRVKKTLSQ